jgi:hypothetical protein
MAKTGGRCSRFVPCEDFTFQGRFYVQLNLMRSLTDRRDFMLKSNSNDFYCMYQKCKSIYTFHVVLIFNRAVSSTTEYIGNSFAEANREQQSQKADHFELGPFGTFDRRVLLTF